MSIGKQKINSFDRQLYLLIEVATFLPTNINFYWKFVFLSVSDLIVRYMQCCIKYLAEGIEESMMC